MTQSKNLIAEIAKRWPLSAWGSSTIVIAASGGADSTALLDVILKMRPAPDSTIVAHYNHALRGHASDGDERFVLELAQSHGLKCITRRRPSVVHRDCSEESLRKERYQFLSAVAQEVNADWIVLGHHADDQIETFLHRLLRGTGPKGLAGMKTIRRDPSGIALVRPLLSCHRRDILTHLESAQLSYRTDHSNQTNLYTRNRIRNELLPSLRQFAGSHLDARLLQTIELLSQQQSMIEAAAQQLLESDALRWSDEGVTFPIAHIDAAPWPVVRQFLIDVWFRRGWPLREMSLRHWERIRKLIDQSQETPHPKQLDLPGHLRVRYRKSQMQVIETSRLQPAKKNGTSE